MWARPYADPSFINLSSFFLGTAHLKTFYFIVMSFLTLTCIWSIMNLGAILSGHLDTVHNNGTTFSMVDQNLTMLPENIEKVAVTFKNLFKLSTGCSQFAKHKPFQESDQKSAQNCGRFQGAEDFERGEESNLPHRRDVGQAFKAADPPQNEL